MDYPFEPFKIKSVEPIYLTTKEERKRILEEAGYNVFNIKSKYVTVDLLTDSGTGSMSQFQWAALMRGDESYAGASSFERFEEAVRKYTGKKHVIPTHQGRAAEKIIAHVLFSGQDGLIAVSNTFFDTTRANFQFQGAEVIDLPSPKAKDIFSDEMFKGDIDLEKLEEILKTRGDRVKLITMTVTNNTQGGQPVSIGNIKKVHELAKKYGVLLHIDACRVSENSYFVKKYEPGFEEKSIPEIVRETLSYADIVTMSAKKDGLVNIGGYIATDDEGLALKFKEMLILWEGFPTYGGLAGRDLEAIAVGLMESLDESYLEYRVGQVRYLGEGFKKAGIPVMWPTGGHAVYVEASRFLPHIKKGNFPAQALVVALYLEGGIRAVEIGSLMFGKDKEVEHEFVRFAIPRRVYTRSHMDYVIEVMRKLRDEKAHIKGLEIVYEPPYLRHFLARLKPVD